MAEAPGQTEVEQLGLFFDYIYGTQEGFVYVARKTPGNQHAFKQDFFSWPTRRLDLVNFVLASRDTFEVYTAPAMFTTDQGADKSHVQGASVYWVEFDGKTPDDLLGLPEPTLRIQSSNEGHEHWYWKLDESVTSVPDIESVNRALTYLFSADSSGWDATQILRPPFTFNHKRERETKILEVREKVYLSPGLFSGLPQPPPPVEAPIPDSIPPIEQVILKYPFPDAATQLFRSGPNEGKRSDQLMSLGYYCAEMNMVVEEILAVLMNADERWQKFAGRQDRMTRLMEIVTIARAKYPPKTEGDRLEFMGLETLLSFQLDMTWAWEGFLQEGGSLVLAGAPGVGKTMFSLQAAAAMALGKPFLDRATGEPKRVGFFSLEMGHLDLKYFLMQMAEAWTAEERRILHENLQLCPRGEPLYMDTPEVRSDVEETIKYLELDGVFIDSLGAATDGEIADEKVKRHFHWNDQLRKRTGAFVWYVHHNRKATGDNKKPNKLDDVLGSRYITTQATTVIGLGATDIENIIECIPLKVRMGKCPPKFRMSRDNNLHFTRLTPGIGPQGEIEVVTNDSDSSGQSGVLDSPVAGGFPSVTGGVAGALGANPGEISSGSKTDFSI